jgi:hypothetical protein
MTAPPKRVADYYPESRLGLEGFTARYPRPFLVGMGAEFEKGEASTTDFFTTVLEGDNISSLMEIAQGRMLNPEAPVFPMIKRTGVLAHSNLVTIGRADNCDIVITAPGISKSHCYISTVVFKDDQYILADMGSTNGTRLNDEPLAPGHKPALESGDRISIGDGVVLGFYLSEGFWKALKRLPPKYS